MWEKEVQAAEAGGQAVTKLSLEHVAGRGRGRGPQQELSEEEEPDRCEVSEEQPREGCDASCGPATCPPCDGGHSRPRAARASVERGEARRLKRPVRSPWDGRRGLAGAEWEAPGPG